MEETKLALNFENESSDKIIITKAGVDLPEINNQVGINNLQKWWQDKCEKSKKDFAEDSLKGKFVVASAKVESMFDSFKSQGEAILSEANGLKLRIIEDFKNKFRKEISLIANWINEIKINMANKKVQENNKIKLKLLEQYQDLLEQYSNLIESNDQQFLEVENLLSIRRSIIALKEKNSINHNDLLKQTIKCGVLK